MVKSKVSSDDHFSSALDKIWLTCKTQMLEQHEKQLAPLRCEVEILTARIEEFESGPMAFLPLALRASAHMPVTLECKQLFKTDLNNHGEHLQRALCQDLQQVAVTSYGQPDDSLQFGPSWSSTSQPFTSDEDGHLKSNMLMGDALEKNLLNPGIDRASPHNDLPTLPTLLSMQGRSPRPKKTLSSEAASTDYCELHVGEASNMSKQHSWQSTMNISHQSSDSVPLEHDWMAGGESGYTRAGSGSPDFSFSAVDSVRVEKTMEDDNGRSPHVTFKAVLTMEDDNSDSWEIQATGSAVDERWSRLVVGLMHSSKVSWQRAVSTALQWQSTLKAGAFVVHPSWQQHRNLINDRPRSALHRSRTTHSSTSSMSMISHFPQLWFHPRYTTDMSFGCIQDIPQRPMGMIHPKSAICVWWNVLRLICLCYDAIAVPIAIAFQCRFWPYEELVSTIFWTLDVAVSVRTGFYNEQDGKLHMSGRSAWKRYLRTWGSFDISMIIAQWMTVSVLDVFDIDVVRSIGALRLLRVRKLQWMVIDAARKFNYHFLSGCHIGHFVAVKLAGFVFWFLHVQACIWFLIGRSHPGGWVHTQLEAASEEVITWWDKYLLSLYWSTMLQASGDAQPCTTAEYVFSILALVADVTVVCLVCGTVTSLLKDFGAQDSRALKTRVTIDRLVGQYRIPGEYLALIEKYVQAQEEQQTARAMLKAEHELTAALPHSLTKRLHVFIRKESLQKCQFLTVRHIDSNVLFFREMCHEHLEERQMFADDIIFEMGTCCTTMWFVTKGTLSYRYQKPSLTEKRMENAYVTKLVSDATDNDGTPLERQDVEQHSALCEAALWTFWRHRGLLKVETTVKLLMLKADAFNDEVAKYPDICKLAVNYACQFVRDLNSTQRTLLDTDTFMFNFNQQETGSWGNYGNHFEHLIFLSHYKVEAGTEATLMMEEMTAMIQEDMFNPSCNFASPVFVDSEDLEDLTSLRAHIEKAHNFLILLTPGVLTRKWCLMEMVTAVRLGIEITTVEVQREGMKFQYPDELFYKTLREGQLLSQSDVEFLQKEGITVCSVEAALRGIFKKIAKPFSPHKTCGVRQAELADILQRCPYRRKS